MLRAAIICPDGEVATQLHMRLEGVSGIAVVRKATEYLAGEELGRLVRAQVPEVFFVSVEDLSQAIRIVTEVETFLDGVQFVAIGRHAEPPALLELMRKGVREFLAYPVDERPLLEALVRIKDILDRKPVKVDATDKVYGFLPAKHGVGATTITVNTAVAVSRLTDNKCLLVDTDRVSGMVRFQLQLDNGYSLQDALDRSLHLDENLWPQLIARFGPLDVIHSGSLRPEAHIEAGSTRHLIDFARRNYSNIFLDFTGTFDPQELEAMHECKKLFLIVTPEVSSLHIAKEKIAYLNKSGMKDRVEIILNRHPKRPVIQLASVAEILGKPVHMAFGNYYLEVNRSLTSGKPVDQRSELGTEFVNFARVLLDKKAVQPEHKKKMSDLFSRLPGSLSLLSPAKKQAN